MAKTNPNTNASRDLEANLWAAADKLRGTLDAAEYKHVVLGLIFLKHISDAFEERRADLERLSRDKDSDLYVKNDEQRERLLEDKDEYSAVNVFWVPPKARWSELQNNAKKSHIAQVIDGAMDAIERANPRLRGVLPADYARRNVAAERLGELIDLVGSIPLGDKKSKAKDVLGGVYQYFLGKFAAAEGKLGGEFFTATCVVRLLVRMLEPYKGRVFDPCCGSAGMFVQSEKFVEEHQGRIGDISIFGQESNPTTWKLANMNLAIRGIEAHLGQTWADSFLSDQHKDLKADFILANPPFNVSDWSGFIDARKMGMLISRVQRELRDGEEVDEIGQIADTYHTWRNQGENYKDKPGFCKSSALDEIRGHNCVLTPGRFVGTAEAEDDSEGFEGKIRSLVARLREQFEDSDKLEKAIEAKLKGLDLGI